MIDLPIFKCRASAIGLIMTNGRGKDAGMGETAKTYLKEWVISQITGNQKDIESKYLSHGVYAETFALDMASDYFGCKFKKNNERLFNDFFEGEFDSKSDIIVIDAKCPWDEFTMPYFEPEPPKGYYGQLQIYMDLTGLDKAALFYALVNHSDDDIERLSQKLARKEADKLGMDADDEIYPTIEHWNEAKKRLTFDNLPNWMRKVVYEFNRDDEFIEAAKQRVLECREVIKNEIVPQLNKLKLINK